jgi:hypothetical protein
MQDRYWIGFVVGVIGVFHRMANAASPSQLVTRPMPVVYSQVNAKRLA